MPYTSEIEKLERRYAENPQGRNFAPLADAYRKAGEVDQAIELCKSGLEHHPDYVSAHIVLGRCFMGKRSDGEAEQVFRRVLELDPENVIAFKVLADIGTRGGRFDDAVTWLTRLLSADPMNGDAAEALAVAKRKAAQAATVPEPVKAVAPVPPPATPQPSAEPLVRAVPEAVAPPPKERDFVVEHASAPPVAAAPNPEPAAAGLEIFDGTLNFSAVANDAPKTEGLELIELEEAEEVSIPPTAAVEGLARTQYEASGIFKLDPPSPPPPAAAQANPEPDDLPTVDLPLIMPDDVPPPTSRRTTEFSFPVPPPPSPSPVSPLPAPPPPPAPLVRAAGTPPGRTSTPIAAAVALSDDDGAADTAALSRAEPVLTETMAELYLKQGHEEDARRVYEALLKQRPGDDRLRARARRLLGGGEKAASSGETVRSFLKSILTRRPGGEEAGSPLDSAFAPTQSEGDIPGEPTRLAGNSISLDEVFGEERGPGSTPVPAPVESASGTAEHAGPGEAAAGASSTGGSGGFSFDEFFAAKGAPEANAAPEGAKAAARASGARPKPQGEEHADLDQFQAWLKGLKA